MTKQDIDGEGFDYKFDVNISDEQPHIYLGYNIGEDPDWTAQRFVEKHHLPIGYLKEIANFLRENVPELKSGGGFVRIGGGVVPPSSSYVDPYSGTARHIPEMKPGEVEAKTTTDSDSKVAAQVPQKVGGEKLPAESDDGYYKFDAEKVSAKASQKLREMNDRQTESEKKLSEAQLVALEKISSQMKVGDDDADLLTAFDVALPWALNTVAPFIDILGLAMLNPEMNNILCSQPKGDAVLQRLIWFLVGTEEGMTDGLRVFICRALANAANHEPGRKMIDGKIKLMLEIVSKEIANPKPVVKVAVGAVIHNLAVMLMRGANAEGEPESASVPVTATTEGEGETVIISASAPAAV